MLAQELGVLVALGISYAVLLNEALGGLEAALPQLGLEDIKTIISGDGLADLSRGDRELAIAVIVDVIGSMYVMVWNPWEAISNLEIDIISLLPLVEWVYCRHCHFGGLILVARSQVFLKPHLFLVAP
jgi:hypothetical protein